MLQVPSVRETTSSTTFTIVYYSKSNILIKVHGQMTGEEYPVTPFVKLYLIQNPL